MYYYYPDDGSGMKEHVSFKYQGDLVDNGIIDAASGALVLRGIDTCCKYFLQSEVPRLAGVDIPIPVLIRKGSWETVIPIGLVSTFGVMVSVYSATAVKKLAENDFKDLNSKIIFQKIYKCVEAIIKIGTHIGHISIKSIKNIIWRDNKAIITNSQGLSLSIEREIFIKIYNCPKYILQDLASVVEEKRVLHISIVSDDSCESITINNYNKNIFCYNENSEELLFPELSHGSIVTIEGIVTRGNSSSNTIGFLYEGHILTCYPRSASITQYKEHLFNKCRISGEVTRANKKGQLTEIKPRIIFDNIETIEHDPQLFLPFSNDDTLDD